MKRKYLLLLAMLMLGILLSGCSGGVATPSIDEAKYKVLLMNIFQQ